MRRWGLAIAFATCLTLSGCAIMPQDALTVTPVVKVGGTAPGFRLPTLNGSRTVTLKSLLHGKPLIVNTWAAWCENCKRETPDLVRLEKQYRGQVTVVGVDTADNLAKAKAFAKQYDMTYLLLNDNVKGSFMNDYNVQGLPTTFVISPSGRIIHVHPGALAHQAMVALFRAAANLATT